MGDLARKEILAYLDLMDEMEQKAMLATLVKMVWTEELVCQASMERRGEKVHEDYLE